MQRFVRIFAVGAMTAAFMAAGFATAQQDPGIGAPARPKHNGEGRHHAKSTPKPVAAAPAAAPAPPAATPVAPAAPAAAPTPAPAVPAEAAPSRAAAAAAPEQLPNGAASIVEGYGDWTVTCRTKDGKKACLLSQIQGDRKTNQQTFAVELRPPAGGRTEGTILMPLGVKLDSGAIVKLDGRDLGQGLRFVTCLPQGCLLAVSLSTEDTDAIRKASKMTVAALRISNGEVVGFEVSLNGFGPALDRIAQLAQ